MYIYIYIYIIICIGKELIDKVSALATSAKQVLYIYICMYECMRVYV